MLSNVWICWQLWKYFLFPAVDLSVEIIRLVLPLPVYESRCDRPADPRGISIVPFLTKGTADWTECLRVLWYAHTHHLFIPPAVTAYILAWYNRIELPDASFGRGHPAGFYYSSRINNGSPGGFLDETTWQVCYCVLGTGRFSIVFKVAWMWKLAFTRLLLW